MSIVSSTLPPAQVLVEEIRQILKRDPRPKTTQIAIRTLILLSQICALPDYEMIPPSAFIELRRNHDLNLLVCGKLSVLVDCFSDLNATTIAFIQEELRKMLDEGGPRHSLRRHFAAALNAPSLDTDRIPKDLKDSSVIKSMFSMALINIDAIESFTVRATDAVSDKVIVELICGFYTSCGFAAAPKHAYVHAHKDDVDLTVNYTNYSDTPSRRIFIAIKEA